DALPSTPDTTRVCQIRAPLVVAQEGSGTPAVDAAERRVDLDGNRQHLGLLGIRRAERVPPAVLDLSTRQPDPFPRDPPHGLFKVPALVTKALASLPG